MLLQSESVGAFLHETFRTLEPPHESLVDDVHEDRLFDVWRKDPAAMTREAALAAGGAPAELAETLPENATVYDLRTAPIGMGFAWGRYKEPMQFTRLGHERVFGAVPPERRGLLGRLRGR